MKTRMQKYYDENNNNTLLRQYKNEFLYEDIKNYEVDDYKLETNVTVLDNNAQNIDVEKIKKILDTKYNQAPKRKSIVVEETDEDFDINIDETREYDINAILEKARNEKEADYESERLKKLRDTQYDILNSLDVDSKKEIKDENKKADELMELINTITLRELNLKENDELEELDPLDILTDLKGSDDTVVVGALHEQESIGETSPIMSLDQVEKIKPKKKEMKETSKELTNTFEFTNSDFEDFDDLKKEAKSSRFLVYVIILLVILILAVGLLIFFDKYLNIPLF